MDQSKVPHLESVVASLKKKRSQTSRRPKSEGQSHPDHSSMSSTPVSDDMSKFSSDENIDGHSGGKMFNLNQCVSRSLPVEPVPISGANNGAGTESRLKKVKLKVGGVTRTFHTKSCFNGVSSGASHVKGNQPSDNSLPRQRLMHQGNSDEYDSVQMDKKIGLQGIPWKDFSGNFGIAREENLGKTSARNAVEYEGDKLEGVRKSRRVRKRRMDDAFDEDDEDDEIRYLEKLKTSKMSGYKDLEPQSARKPQRGSIPEAVEVPGRVAKKLKSGNMDYAEEEGSFSDVERSGGRKKKQKKDLSELQTESKKEIALTTRQRALLSKDSSSAAGASLLEFPNCLPLAPPRKQKEKLSEMEQQLKKAEAAQRRKLQNEKAARETEEEAIRKILGQDSSRKKREEKMKKRQEELAQEKMANALLLASNTIRTIMGPNGTTVSFPEEMGYPKIFEPNAPRYPPARETCAGPSCCNPYKYRDSKSMLPLCSLQCYKAIHESMGTEKAC